MAIRGTGKSKLDMNERPKLNEVGDVLTGFLLPVWYAKKPQAKDSKEIPDGTIGRLTTTKEWLVVDAKRIPFGGHADFSYVENDGPREEVMVLRLVCLDKNGGVPPEKAWTQPYWPKKGKPLIKQGTIIEVCQGTHAYKERIAYVKPERRLRKITKWIPKKGKK
jgi:hypothetical protein